MKLQFTDANSKVSLVGRSSGRGRVRTIAVTLLLLLPIMMLGACHNIGYYAQAVRGQSALLLKRQPIDRMLADASLDPQLRERLELVVAAREFAATELGLASAGSYTTYVDPGRQHLVWSVFAAPADSLEPVTWCFPVAGCVTYRGYFSEQAAQRYAERLRQRGHDVYIGGVDAYSTLGWFRDPVPATVMRRADHRLVGLIFHELAHQRYYLPGDTSFNESFASFVEQEGVRRWFAARADQESYAQYQQDALAQQYFISFVLDYRQQFADLYAENLPLDDLILHKRALQTEMRTDWQSSGIRGYDGWFNGPLNNAQLNTVGAYADWVPAFEALFTEAGEDIEVFYAAVADLGAMSAEQRNERLQELSAAASPLVSVR